MSDQITDTRNAARPNSARATGTRSAGGNSLACDNLAGWPVSPRKVHFVTYQIDSSSEVVDGTQLDCSGIVTGNTINSFTVIDGTDLGNSVNDVVEMLPTAAWGQDLADALTNQHTRTGAHSGITNTGGLTTDTLNATGNSTVGGTLGVTGATTLTGAVGGTGYDVKTLANSYKFSVYRNAAWTPATNTVGLVQFDTKEFDTGTNIDVATNKGRFTAPIAGYYHFDSTVTSAGVNNGAQIGIFLYKNGSSFKAGQFIDQVFSATGTRSPSVAYSGTVQLAAGDYVEIYYYGNAGTGSTGAILTHFSGFLVSAT